MSGPLVAIVGRPNVGKSTLFNKLSRRRRAIVHNQPGITRDRVEARVDLAGRQVMLQDTGGFEGDAADLIRRGIRDQVVRAMKEADCLLFVVDARQELTAEDFEIAELVRKSGTPVLLAANKVDTRDKEEAARRVLHLHELGFGEPLPVSAEHSLGLDRLAADCRDLLPVSDAAEGDEETGLRLAFLGRPNVGKSSIVNALLCRPRCLVTEIPGTTRDAVDVLYQDSRGNRYRFIDTAGIRRRGKVREKVEKLSVMMARRSLKRADVAFIVLDAAAEVSHQDLVVGGICAKSHRSVGLLINKWDLVEGEGRQAARRIVSKVREKFKHLDFSPILKVSAHTGKGIPEILSRARRLYQAAGATVKTPELNRFCQEVIRLRSPGGRHGADLRIYYMTQAGTHPPTFNIFANSRKIHFSYRRFVENRLREAFGFGGSPIVLRFVRKPKRYGRPEEPGR